MRIHAFRLLPGQDLMQELSRFAIANRLSAAVVLCAVGSLSSAVLRDAGGEALHMLPGPWEIVSATGTVSINGSHLHLSLAGQNLQTVGGHAKDGCTVLTTVELVLGEADQLVFDREPDPATGYRELVVSSCESKNN